MCQEKAFIFEVVAKRWALAKNQLVFQHPNVVNNRGAYGLIGGKAQEAGKTRTQSLNYLFWLQWHPRHPWCVIISKCRRRRKKTTTKDTQLHELNRIKKKAPETEIKPISNVWSSCRYRLSAGTNWQLLKTQSQLLLLQIRNSSVC